MLGMSRSPGQSTSGAGSEMPVGSIRRVDRVGPDARPLPVPLRFVDDDTPGPAGGIGGALYPEWDVHKNRYRAEWCRVIDFPLGRAPTSPPAASSATRSSAGAWPASGSGPRCCAAAPTAMTSTSTPSSTSPSTSGPATPPPRPSTSNGASWPATSASSSSSTPPARPPRPTPTAAPSTSTSAGLLVVLSDGFPYDDGYESRYAEADSYKALEELRADSVACLCLSIGASTGTDALDRVFGSASHANAATLGELSPKMDELFLGALKELAAPKPASRG
jgi:hypothetical protein